MRTIVWLLFSVPVSCAISPCGSLALLGTGILLSMSLRYAAARGSMLVMLVVRGAMHFPVLSYLGHTGVEKVPLRWASVGMSVVLSVTACALRRNSCDRKK